MSDNTMEGKVALVTGAARGIGAGAARSFAEAGANVLLVDLLDQVHETAEALAKSGVQCKGLALDLRPEENCAEAVSTALAEFGRLDYAFNNAGIGGDPGPVHEMTGEEWGRMIDINLTAVFYCVKHQIAAMLDGGGGVIINNSSICGARPVEGFCHYVAAKHGVVGLSKTVALEYGSAGIRCNAIGPGFIDTEMTKASLDGEVREGLIARIPQARLGSPDDIGPVVQMLCSDGAAYVNGAYLPVDGGMLAS
jgi:NAD(P)-dependent dehydrogenase (short-subunit alcohol dehydrogenase family)